VTAEGALAFLMHLDPPKPSDANRRSDR